ncbi:MAG TPA: TrkA family potassium uptake protein [Rectinemataceae bacterium]|nr:TrkA family potassium uptake protein [Rectinemataceae bacterium]
MRQYVFIGLGTLAMSMLESISKVTDQIVVVDQNPALIERVKDMVKTAYVADAMDEATLSRILPEYLDVAIVDVSNNLETTLLVTHTLKKMGVAEIIVKAESDMHSEILAIVGATKVVNSDREAAARIVPLVLSTALYNFMPIGGELVMAEVKVPESLTGKTLIEADLRRNNGINIVAIRTESSSIYRNFDRDYRLVNHDVLLVAGNEKEVFAFSGVPLSPTQKQKTSTITSILKTVIKPLRKIH